MKYEVTYVVKKDDETYSGSSIIEFTYDETDYGNGHYMAVHSKDESFGLGLYDIRYDTSFHRDEKIQYIVSFYGNRFDGKPTKYGMKWNLVEISVKAVEDTEEK